MSAGVTVRNRAANAVLAGSVAAVGVSVAAVPVGPGLWRVPWVAVALVATAVAVRRGLRMGVVADADGVLVRNLGRDFRVEWDDIAEISAGDGDNITGAAKTILVKRTDGSLLVGRGASSYSRAKVQRWRDELAAASRERRDPPAAMG